MAGDPVCPLEFTRRQTLKLRSRRREGCRGEGCVASGSAIQKRGHINVHSGDQMHIWIEQQG